MAMSKKIKGYVGSFKRSVILLPLNAYFVEKEGKCIANDLIIHCIKYFHTFLKYSPFFEKKG